MDENSTVAFQIVVDTREQQPYAFACPTVHRKLDAGDYSVVGHEDAVAVERKSLQDFTHTVIHESNRFNIELRKLAVCDASCVVVEADLDDVLRGRATTQLRAVAPASVLGAALHITLRYGVPVFWCGSRQAARAFTEQYLRSFVREYVRHG
jgi:ERCC4-type nuclease